MTSTWGASLLRTAILLLLSMAPYHQGQAKPSTLFECTLRQEAEDLAAIKNEDYRYSQAMVRLGLCALRAGATTTGGGGSGIGGSDDGGAGERAAKIAQGREWLEKAAGLGDPEAKNNLATMYAEGHGGLALDLAKAKELYLEAAGDGCADVRS